jgi:hypothetical protein
MWIVAVVDHQQHSTVAATVSSVTRSDRLHAYAESCAAGSAAPCACPPLLDQYWRRRRSALSAVSGHSGFMLY